MRFLPFIASFCLATGGVFGYFVAKTNEPKQIAIQHPDFSKLDLCEVDHVADGDTCSLKLPNGEKVKVRLVGVDTPETVDPRKEVQIYGPEASTNLKNLLTGEKVWLEQPDNHKPDKYGRTLGYLYRYPDGLCINLEILRNGYGQFLSQYPCKYKQEFETASLKAKDSKKGIYSVMGLTEQTKPVKKNVKKGK